MKGAPVSTASQQRQDQEQAPGAATDLIDLEVGGMTCASCAARIEKKLGKLDGVTAAVNYATEKASVQVPEGTTADDLIAVVERTGYSARVPAEPAPAPSAAGTDPGPDAADEARPGSGAEDPELRDLRHRLIGAAILSVPVIALAMIPALQFDYWGFASLTLAAPVIVWAGWPFHRATLINA